MIENHDSVSQENLFDMLNRWMLKNTPPPPKPGLMPVYTGLELCGWCDPADRDPKDPDGILLIKYDAAGNLFPDEGEDF